MESTATGLTNKNHPEPGNKRGVFICLSNISKFMAFERQGLTGSISGEGPVGLILDIKGLFRKGN